MRRLDYLLKRCDYPEDVLRLQDAIPELQGLDQVTVQRLYSHWSEYWYAAGWLIVDDDSIEEFRGYLLEDM